MSWPKPRKLVAVAFSAEWTHLALMRSELHLYSNSQMREFARLELKRRNVDIAPSCHRES